MELSAFVRRWGATHPPVRLDPDGAWSIPSYASTPVDREVRADLDRVGRRAWPPTVRFAVTARTNPGNAAGFSLDPDDLLHARSHTGALVEKFSWNPVTGEILFVHPPLTHATARGEAPFDDHVRAIVLRDQRLVLFRPFWPTWARASPYDAFDAEAAVVSIDAQCAAGALVSARARGPWAIELNTNNRILTERTGRRDW